MIRLLFLFVFLASCNTARGPGCGDHGDCDGNAICDDVTSTCREVECLSSADCALGAHCAETLNTCVTGCAEDDDCLAGEQCGASGQCESYGCRSTQLDCRYGEVCNGVGECVRTTDPHCMRAEDFTTQLACTNTHGGELACFGTNCSAGTFCLMPCSPTGAECPRGTECYAPFQNDSRTFCTGDCPFLTQHGF